MYRALVPVAAVLGDPPPVRVLLFIALDAVLRRQQPFPNVAIPDQAWRRDDARVEEVTLHRRVEDVAGIGNVAQALRDRLQFGTADPVLFAVLLRREPFYVSFERTGARESTKGRAP